MNLNLFLHKLNTLNKELDILGHQFHFRIEVTPKFNRKSSDNKKNKVARLIICEIRREMISFAECLHEI